MLPSEKLKTLEPEQIEKLSKIKNSSELKAFIAETGIELTEEELESIAGGLPILRPKWVG